MIKIGVQTGGLEDIYGTETMYRVVKEAGFDAVDVGIERLFPQDFSNRHEIPPVFNPNLSEKEMLEFVKPYRENAKKYGIDNFQAHALIPTMRSEPDTEEYNAFLLECLKKNIIMCDYIGARNLTVHPFFMQYPYQVSPEEEWETNIRSYMSLAKTAIEYGVTVNLENIFMMKGSKVYAACCNDPFMAAKYVDTLNEAAGKKCFGFTLDTGHALMVGHDIRRFMDVMGERITSFHVHDNDGMADTHRAPFWGILDWDRFVLGLKDIGFDKTICFETYATALHVPKELVPETLRYIVACGRYFASKAAE